MNSSKVDNAIIMAAGLSSRFVPLSLEKPKGLLKVKGEVLIERQIRQLHEKGITNITVVVGYKKESFFYLKEKFGVKLVVNDYYDTKNNIETLYLVRNSLKNTYICSSDDYFTTNPFSSFEEQSFYSSIHITHQSNEWYIEKDEDNNIKGVHISGREGDIMLGAVFFDENFSSSFVPLIEKAHSNKHYDDKLWEYLFIDNIASLPKMKVRLFPDNTIFEFDSLEDLRFFDKKYINNSESKIMENIAKTLNCSEGALSSFALLKNEDENFSFEFEFNKTKYIYEGDKTNYTIKAKV